MQQANLLRQRLLKELDISINDNTEAMASGQCEDWAQYRYMTAVHETMLAFKERVNYEYKALHQAITGDKQNDEEIRH